ncbi:MAG: preprotein translocase subunit SecG [Bacteroidia bacterium]|nr:preprotein translocase subunit SecG [Bacteroidia bacterium]
MGLLGILIILVCAVLIFIVLVQNSKGGGLASNFASNNQILGVAKTKDILEQVTWGAAGLLFIFCLLSTPPHAANTTKVDPKAKTTTTGKGSQTKGLAKATQSPMKNPLVNPTAPTGKP